MPTGAIPSLTAFCAKPSLRNNSPRELMPTTKRKNILARELPILPLASSLRLQAYRYDIKGLVLSPFGNASFAGVSGEKG
uniref:Peptide transport periplasmic protein SapA n=1 Tax=Klebsiella pneumoniae TaxID=573 RepID=A0A8B0T0E5_KLEPN|nr:Peptide transport periplasmic protein SapA [Klebsiella pneumoniae]